MLTFTNFTYYAEYNKWDNGKEGNYWSNYQGQDINGNGIGKTSYRVYDNFTDYYPLMQPYDVSKIQVTFETWNETYVGSIWDDTQTGPQSLNSEGDNPKFFR
jgi:nitrous oxidase accessory protein NosD